MDNLYSEDLHPAYNMSFDNDRENTGTLSWTDGELKFEGNVHESAKIFFEFLKPYIDEYIKNKGGSHESNGLFS